MHEGHPFRHKMTKQPREIWLQKTEVPFDPAIPILGIYPEKTRTQKDTGTPLVIAALVTVAKTWKQLKMSIDRRDKEDVVHIHNGMLLSPKKNEIMAFAATWMDIEITTLSKISHIVRRKQHMLSLICGILKKDAIKLFAEQKWTRRL